jgi:hypothetical protein
MIAALYVETGGVYWDLDGVDPWDEARDARLYTGPWPVVAHPPCARWSRLAGFVEARFGYKRGDDGGCFESAIASVRQFGGVLEHPAYSDAWPAFGLPTPLAGGGWQRGLCGGWSCQVEQIWYGHRARKPTWLYAFGVSSLPSLRWGAAPAGTQPFRSSTMRRANGQPRADRDKPGLSSRALAATPIEFRDTLIAIARSAQTMCPVSSSC